MDDLIDHINDLQLRVSQNDVHISRLIRQKHLLRKRIQVLEESNINSLPEKLIKLNLEVIQLKRNQNYKRKKN